MNNDYLLVAVTLGSIIVGSVLGVWISGTLQKRKSLAYRTANDIPNILGRWHCQWYDDNSAVGQPRIEDVVEITSWTSHGEFAATGHQEQRQLTYPIVGDIDPSRIVTLAYKAARYPFEVNRGVACMELSRDGLVMEGFWIGRRASNRLGGGRVKCTRARSLAEVAVGVESVALA